MDRSYLSQPSVIKASRGFVCVRTMTYESAEEAKVLRALWGRGELENTVFAILDPTGKPVLSGQRGPHRLFRDASALAAYMDKVSNHYRGHGDPTWLPVVDTVRLGLNVAACDNRPLAIVVANNQRERAALEAKLAPAAWSDELIGKMIYTAGSPKELKNINGARISSGYIFVLPDEFGTKGEILAQLQSDAPDTALRNAARQAISARLPGHQSHHQHVMEGRRTGTTWQSAIPVTDQQALRAQNGMGGPPGSVGYGGHGRRQGYGPR